MRRVMNWKAYGMWVILDVLLLLFLFALTPIFLGISITPGLLHYAHSFVVGIAGILVIASLFAFHKGSMVNLRHPLIKNITQWWGWIVFHWFLAVVICLEVILILFLITPLFEGPWMYPAIGVFVLYLLVVVHYVSVSQYYYLKYKKMWKALGAAMTKQYSKKLRRNVYNLLLPQLWLLLGFLLMEWVSMQLFSGPTYTMIDGILVPLYFATAGSILYVHVMRNRAYLYG